MGELAAVGASVFWAFASLVFSQLGQKTPPIALNALKCSIALVLMTGSLIILEGMIWPASLTMTQLGFLAASGIIGLTIGDSAYFGALIRLGPRRALLFTSLTPPTTALLAVPFLDEPLTLAMGGAILVTVIGVTWVIMERSAESSGAKSLDLFGVGLALLGVLCQSGGNILTKLGGETISALSISVVRLAFGTLTLGILIGAIGQLPKLKGAFENRKDGMLLFVATFLGTYLGIWLLNAGLKYTYAGVAATLSSTSPIWILPLSRIFLKEKISARAIGGAFIAVIGVALLLFFKP